MDELDLLTVTFLETHPQEAARELERQPAAEAALLLAGAPARVLGPVLAAMQPRAAAAALMALDSERAALVLGALPYTAAAGILRHVPPARRAAMLETLPSVATLACRALLRYPEDAIGAFAQTQVLALDEQATAAEALAALRVQHEDTEGVFVVTHGQRLRGWVACGRLVQSEAVLRLSMLARPITRLPALMPVAAALEEPAFASTPVVAVVEQGDRLLGAVTLAALRRALDTRARAPQFAAAGTPLALLGAGYWRAVAGLAEAAVGVLMPNPRAPR